MQYQGSDESALGGLDSGYLSASDGRETGSTAGKAHAEITR
ncbi:MAG TPA: hypothetical protein VEP90_05580 [Methylomirabilota bacterium]|nr:hypothetical protein [Methylomirabilota bacterium]